MRTVYRMLAAAALCAGARAVCRLAEARYSFADRTAIVTGGARGLGLEIARRLAREGARVAICARTAADVHRAVEELRTLTPAVLGICCDVSAPAQIEAFVHQVYREWGPLDVLVNNAGVIQVGPLAAMTEADFEHALGAHLWGPLRAVHAALPRMRADGEARIVNISSIGGKISVPHLLPYCASKFALAGFSQGLRAELTGKGVHVTTVTPGLMRTGSPRNAIFKGDHRAEYAWFSIGGSLPGLSISSANAARQIVEACRRGQAELTPGAAARAAILFNTMFPNWTAALLRLTNSLLPKSRRRFGTESHRGSESFSKWSPSVLTTLTEQAAAANNELGPKYVDPATT